MASTTANPTWSFGGVGHADGNTASSIVATPTKQSSMAAHTPLKLRLEKHFLHPIQPDLISLCPTLDLVAVVTGEKQFECFRFDGHRAFWHKKSTPAVIKAIAWLQDGSSNISIAWSDGKLEYISSTGGRVLETIDTARQQRSARSVIDQSVTCLQSARNYVATAVHATPSDCYSQKGMASGYDANTAIDVALREDTTSASKNEIDTVLGNLPRELEFLDLVEDFPPLGVLNLGAEDPNLLNHSWSLPSDYFCTQDRINRSVNRSLPTIADVDVPFLLLSRSDGSVGFMLYDGIDMGSRRLVDNDDNDREIVAHASHSSTNFHAFLSSENWSTPTEEGCGDNKGLAVTIVSLRVLDRPAHLLPLVIETTRLLQRLQQYILQTVKDLRQIFKAWQRLPGRFIEIISENILEQGSEMDLPAALYTLAVTGFTLPVVKEWLVDQLGPMQHKRWDAAVDSGYNAIQEITHGCLLPAIDRASIVASRLRVLSRNPDKSFYKLDESLFAQLNSSLDTLRLVGQNVLLHTRHELQQFKAFSPWLSLQIQLLGTETMSSSAAELGEKAAALDISLVLSYITGALMKSRLALFLGSNTDVIVKSINDSSDNVADSREMRRRASKKLMVELLNKHSKSPIEHTDETFKPPNLLCQALALLHDSAPIIDCISADFTSSLHVTPDLVLAVEGMTRIYDMRMVLEEDNGEWRMYTYVMVVPSNDTSSILLSRITRGPAGASEEGSLTRLEKGLSIRFSEGEVVGLEVEDDYFMLVLLRWQDESAVVRVAYSFPMDQMNGISPHVFAERFGNTNFKPLPWTVPNEFLDSEPIVIELSEVEILHAFAHPNGVGEFVPAHIQVSERRQLLVLEKQRTRIRVFQLEATEQGRSTKHG